MKTIPLTQGKITLVDDEDFVRVSAHKWNVDVRAGGKKIYARGWVGRRPTRQNYYLHRFILGTWGGVEIDHIDGDGLNNQKSNLRLCSRLENTRNSRRRSHSGFQFKGVRWHVRGKKWHARIIVGGKEKSLGLFADEQEAARAYDCAARELFGEFARPNLP